MYSARTDKLLAVLMVTSPDAVLITDPSLNFLFIKITTIPETKTVIY